MLRAMAASATRRKTMVSGRSWCRRMVLKKNEPPQMAASVRSRSQLPAERWGLAAVGSKRFTLVLKVARRFDEVKAGDDLGGEHGDQDGGEAEYDAIGRSPEPGFGSFGDPGQMWSGCEQEGVEWRERGGEMGADEQGVPEQDDQQKRAGSERDFERQSHDQRSK